VNSTSIFSVSLDVKTRQVNKGSHIQATDKFTVQQTRGRRQSERHVVLQGHNPCFNIHKLSILIYSIFNTFRNTGHHIRPYIQRTPNVLTLASVGRVAEGEMGDCET
jgi:hypothetical protein